MVHKKASERKQGRPPGSSASVGREGVLASAIRLLKKVPPAQTTLIAIAREARVDPALVRYYFKGREALLFEAVKQMVASDRKPLPSPEPALTALQEQIHRTFRFTRSAKYMQRLMIDELCCA